MALTLVLTHDMFTASPRTLVRSDEWTVETKTYPTGIAALTIRNARGYVEVLPFMGQIIWDAAFDGQPLRMTSMFDAPRPATKIEDTYGCFAFHSGLLSAGCPSPEDDHELHGEFPCAEMDSAELIVSDESIAVRSSREYIKGFGHHYLAVPSVRLDAGSSMFEIDLDVTNLSAYAPMPLQYMCHMNHRFLEGATMHQDIPGGFRLRESIPAHVTPTPRWTEINERILAGDTDPDTLAGAEEFDPEIVYFADHLPADGSELEFTMTSPEGFSFVTAFDPAQFPVATRWILWNPDQKVAAFVLPGTSRPEGRLAAERAGTLISLPAGGTRSFRVRTGLRSAEDAATTEKEARA